MYTTLGALPRASGHGKIPPFVNLQGRNVLATVGRVRRGHLQGFSGLGAINQSLIDLYTGKTANASGPVQIINGVPHYPWITDPTVVAQIVQGLTDGEAGTGVAGWFANKDGSFNLSADNAVWLCAPEIPGKPGSYDTQNMYSWLGPKGSVTNAPAGGQLFLYSQAIGSQQANASRGGAVPGFSQTSLTAFGQPLYAVTSSAPAGTPAPAATPSAPVQTAVQTPSTPPPGLTYGASTDTSASGGGGAVPVVQGPVQSSAPIQSTVSMLPAPAVPGMDTTAAQQSTAVAAAINGQNVSATYPAPYQDGGSNWLLWGGLGLAAFLLLRR